MNFSKKERLFFLYPDTEVTNMPLRMVRIGDIGPDVKAIQEGLNKSIVGQHLVTDGKFGNHTDRAVREFQTKHNLKVDGIVGSRTRSRLFPLVATTINMMGLRMPRIGVVRRLQPTLIPQRTFGLTALKFPPLATPVPTPQPPLIPVPKLKFDQFQLQAGGQVSFSNLLQDPQNSWVITMQSVFKRGEDNGRQELALGMQVGVPIFVPGGGDPDLTLSWFANFTWVDPLGALGRFHLWSPFATADGQTDFSNKQLTVGAGLFPINLSVDLINDHLSIQAQSGIAGTYGLKTQELTWGIQTTFGLSGSISVF